MNDDDVLDTVKDRLSGVHLRTPVEAIVSSGRSRQRRRVAGSAAAGLAVAGLAVAGLAAGLAPGLPAADRSGTPPTSISANPMRPVRPSRAGSTRVSL